MKSTINNVPNYLGYLGLDYYDAQAMKDTNFSSIAGTAAVGSSLIIANIVCLPIAIISTINFVYQDYQLNNQLDYLKVAHGVAANLLIPAFDTFLFSGLGYEDSINFYKYTHDSDLYLANTVIGEYLELAGKSYTTSEV